MERGGNDEVQTCSRDESYQSEAVHEIFKSSTYVCDRTRNLIEMALDIIAILPCFAAHSIGLRLMNWKSCGRSNMIWLKKATYNCSIRGASIRAKIFSKYSVIIHWPL